MRSAVLEPWRALRGWPRRRWAVAAAAAGAGVLAVGLVTVLIPNPVFGREVPPTWWSWPVLLVAAGLSGLLSATYVRVDGPGADAPSRAARLGAAGGFLAYLAVGCPVCNKLALLALGYAGALQWFAPVQPLLGVTAVVLLGYALHRRLTGELACPVVVRSA